MKGRVFVRTETPNPNIVAAPRVVGFGKERGPNSMCSGGILFCSSLTPATHSPRANVVIDGSTVNLELWDTAGLEDVPHHLMMSPSMSLKHDPNPSGELLLMQKLEEVGSSVKVGIPPESVFDWTWEIDSYLSNQNINNQSFPRKHWRLLQCQDGLRSFEELGEVDYLDVTIQEDLLYKVLFLVLFIPSVEKEESLRKRAWEERKKMWVVAGPAICLNISGWEMMIALGFFAIARRTIGPIRRAKGGWTAQEVSLY
ncbi:hypothetical protein JHK84_045359 [Glycine max]|nr:hypothetical protein JHK84_045359 [Glycine max]